MTTLSTANTNTINYILAVQTDRVKTDINKIESSAMRIVNYLAQAGGGNPDIAYITSRITKAETMARSLFALMQAVNMASGPVGWFSAGLSGVATAFSFFDLTAGY